MADERTHTSFIDYPSAEANDKPYEAPAPYNNPTVKGLTLHLLSNV